MMTDAETVFIDTNILVYATDERSPFHSRCRALLDGLIEKGIGCAISPQIVREYLVVFTRAASSDNTVRLAVLENIERFLGVFILLGEDHETVSQLRTIVANSTVGGKQIHDANIVAVMQVHGVKRLLTHNLDDFKGYAQWIETVSIDEGFA